MNLPTLAPNATRAARIHSRCHERLAQQRQLRQRRELVAIRIERTVVCGLCAAYLVAMAFNALQPFFLS